MKRRIGLFTAAILMILMLMLLSTGCSGFLSLRNQDDIQNPGESGQKEQGMVIDPEPKPETRTITLYYKHEFSDYLVPEKRDVQQTNQSIEQLIMEELFKGPRGFQRVLAMPKDLKVLDVTRKGDIVFVNLSKELKNNVDFSVLPDKLNVPIEERPMAALEMKRLAIYSIVNSLTELDGVNQVKILVENRPPTYNEIGAQLLIGGAANITADSSMLAITRNKNFILSPGKAVEQVLKGMVGEPNWEKVYAFLYDTTMDGTKLASVEDFKKFIIAQGITLEVDEQPVDGEEIKPDGEAFVTVHYTIKYPNGQKLERVKDYITVVYEDGIWKVKLPEALSALH